MAASVAFPDFARHKARLVPPLRCEVRTAETGPTWVCVKGELDIASTPQLERALRAANRSDRAVILDLRGLSFSDSSGIAVIMEASQRARRSGRRLILLKESSQLDLVLHLCGASTVVDIVDLQPPEPPRRPSLRLIQGRSGAAQDPSEPTAVRSSRSGCSAAVSPPTVSAR